MIIQKCTNIFSAMFTAEKLILNGQSGQESNFAATPPHFATAVVRAIYFSCVVRVTDERVQSVVSANNESKNRSLSSFLPTRYLMARTLGGGSKKCAVGKSRVASVGRAWRPTTTANATFATHTRNEAKNQRQKWTFSVPPRIHHPSSHRLLI